MTYKEINEIFGIPQRTLTDWKNTKNDDWRKKMFEFLRKIKKEDIQKLNSQTQL
ncbi:MAG: hypothetical protein GXO40_02010 [Epsilonproteobacteria bacterium]|nr:hypothetical protein [Campylobacterota bacterium]